MELIYSANRPPRSRRDWLSEENAFCCLSLRNLVAFTSATDLSERSKPASLDNICFVYVCDIDAPWEVHPVLSTQDTVISLQWDSTTGTQLLVSTSSGKVHILAMKEYLLNKWECTHTKTIDAEAVVAASWLHSGVKMVFNGDKKDSAMFKEKLSRSKFTAPLCHFGGKATEGYIAVTSTGLVSLGIQKSTVQNTITVTENLFTSRMRILLADIAFDSTGEIHISVSNGQLSAAIMTYCIRTWWEGADVRMVCQPAVSLYTKTFQEATPRELANARITNLRYLSKDSSKSLIVCIGDIAAGYVELWQLVEQNVPVNKVFQQAQETRHKVRRWIHKKTVLSSSSPTSIATPNLEVNQNVFEGASTYNQQLFQYVAVAYKDGSIKLINKHSFQAVTTTNIDVGIGDEEDQLQKKRRGMAHMTSMQQSFTGCSLLGIDQYGCLYVMKAVNTRDTMMQVAPPYMVGMLEYCMMLGLDWWDVLSGLRPATAELIIQKLKDSFNKQPAPLQDFLYCRFMAIQGSLYSCSANSQQRAADCHCRLMLHSLSTAFKGMLQPKTMSALDMSPVEKLKIVLWKNTDPDIDEVLVELSREKVDLTIEGATLQAIQQLVQWVADLSLYLLTSLPMMQAYGIFPGSTLLQDSQALATLRELLVITREWGKINPSCLPHFTVTSQNLDALAHLYKLLTKAWIVLKDISTGREFDDSLIDECCLLPSQILIPSVDQGLFGNISYDNSIFTLPHPISCTFGETPAIVQGSSHAHSWLPEGFHASEQKKDIIHNVSLGTTPAQAVKQCSRCACLTLLSGSTFSKFAALKTWDMRWVKNCMCGGQWKTIEA